MIPIRQQGAESGGKGGCRSIASLKAFTAWPLAKLSFSVAP